MLTDQATNQTDIFVDQFGRHIESLIQDSIRADIEPERITQLRTLQRNERFWRGDHYAYQKLNDNRIEWSSATGNLLAGQESRSSRGLYDYVLNYYYGDGLKLVGILGRMPNVKAVANNKSNDSHVTRANLAEKIISELRWHWDVETQQSELVLSLYKNTTTFAYTPYVANGKRYGRTAVPVINLRNVQLSPERMECSICGVEAPPSSMQCPQCGVPFQPEDYREPEFGEIPELQETLEFDNGSVEFYLCTPYTVSTSFFLKSLNECPWLEYEYEEHSGVLMATYKKLRDMQGEIESYGQQSGASTTATFAREAAASPTRAAFVPFRRGMWRFSRYWLMPQMYELLGRVDGGQIRDRLYELFPDGTKVTMVNGKLIDLEPEKLTDVWAECKPTVGEYLYTPALGNNYIRLNQLINDGFNIMVQTAEKGIPQAFVDPQVIDMSLLRQNQAAVMDYWPALPGASGRLRDAIWQSTPAQLSPHVPEVMTTALEGAREIVGVTKPLWGGEQGQQTLGEAELKRNQALMPHNTTWGYIRRFWQKAYTNAIRQFAKHSGDKLYFRNKATDQPSEMSIENVSDLLAGGWHIECDEAIPMTWGQRRAQAWQMIEKGPEFYDGVIGIKHPSNLQTFHEIVGSNDFEVPGLKNYIKVRETIKKLLSGTPMVNQAPDGSMIVLPSIPVDEFEDDHALSAKAIQEWSQDEGLSVREPNPMGYVNVIAWGKEHLRIMTMQAMPPPQAGGPPGPGLLGNAKPPPAKPDILNPQPPGAPQVPPAAPPPQQGMNTPRPEEMGAPLLERV